MKWQTKKVAPAQQHHHPFLTQLTNPMYTQIKYRTVHFGAVTTAVTVTVTATSVPLSHYIFGQLTV